MATMKRIRRATLANRGGLEAATDPQVVIIWESLPADIHQQYLDSIKNQEVTEDAIGP